MKNKKKHDLINIISKYLYLLEENFYCMYV